MNVDQVGFNESNQIIGSMYMNIILTKLYTPMIISLRKNQKLLAIKQTYYDSVPQHSRNIRLASIIQRKITVSAAQFKLRLPPTL